MITKYWGFIGIWAECDISNPQSGSDHAYMIYGQGWVSILSLKAELLNIVNSSENEENQKVHTPPPFQGSPFSRQGQFNQNMEKQPSRPPSVYSGNFEKSYKNIDPTNRFVPKNPAFKGPPPGFPPAPHVM